MSSFLVWTPAAVGRLDGNNHTALALDVQPAHSLTQVVRLGRAHRLTDSLTRSRRWYGWGEHMDGEAYLERLDSVNR